MDFVYGKGLILTSRHRLQKKTRAVLVSPYRKCPRTTRTTVTLRCAKKLSIVPRSTRTKDIDPVLFAHLLYLRECSNRRLDTKVNRSILEDAFPNTYYISNRTSINFRDKIEDLVKDPSSVAITYANVSSAIVPTRWMEELNDCLDSNLSPFIKYLDRIVELIENNANNPNFAYKRVSSMGK